MGHKCCATHFHSLYKMGRRIPKGMVRPFLVLETLAPFSPAAAPDLAVRRRSSSSYVWIPVEVLYVQHFDDRGIRSDHGTALYRRTSSIIRTYACSGNSHGLLPWLDLGSTALKSFCLSLRDPSCLSCFIHLCCLSECSCWTMVRTFIILGYVRIRYAEARCNSFGCIALVQTFELIEIPLWKNKWAYEILA